MKEVSAVWRTILGEKWKFMPEILLDPWLMCLFPLVILICIIFAVIIYNHDSNSFVEFRESF